MMEQQCFIDIVAVVTDRCKKIGVDAKRFQYNTKTELSIINKKVQIYNDPYHLYKSFCKAVIKGDISEISKEILQKFFEEKNDKLTMARTTYTNSFNSSREYNMTIFNICNFFTL
jgi:hypothetical protein